MKELSKGFSESMKLELSLFFYSLKIYKIMIYKVELFLLQPQITL